MLENIFTCLHTLFPTSKTSAAAMRLLTNCSHTVKTIPSEFRQRALKPSDLYNRVTEKEREVKAGTVPPAQSLSMLCRVPADPTHSDYSTTSHTAESSQVAQTAIT